MSEHPLIGLDIGGTKIAAATITQQGRILGRAQDATSAYRTGEAFGEALVRLVRAALATAGAARPAGIGIGCTGPVDVQRGTVHNPYTLPIPDGSDIVNPLRAAFGAPVALENDADAAALGEHWVGAGAGRELVVCLTFGTGVGAGIVHRGQVVRGAARVHPEIGHLVLDPAGPECYCGARGCWEALASGTAIGKAGQEAAHAGAAPGLLKLAGGQAEAVSPELVFRAARAGDGPAERIVARAVEATANGLFNVMHTLAPDAVIFGGGVMQHYDLFEPALRAALSRCILVPVPDVLLAPARLGADAGVLGAARAAALVLWGPEGRGQP